MSGDFDDFARSLLDDAEYKRRLETTMGQVASALESAAAVGDKAKAVNVAIDAVSDIALLQVRMYHEWFHDHSPM